MIEKIKESLKQINRETDKLSKMLEIKTSDTERAKIKSRLCYLDGEYQTCVDVLKMME